MDSVGWAEIGQELPRQVLTEIPGHEFTETSAFIVFLSLCLFAQINVDYRFKW